MAIHSAETAATVEDDQRTTNTDLYDHPAVYAALRAPAPAMLAGVRSLIREHLLPPRADRHSNGHARTNGHAGANGHHAAACLPSIMDPACGPANWLEPFARAGHRVAGNDLSPRMVEGAEQVLSAIARERATPYEVVHGDMRDLRFSTGPFDVAIEIAGTTGLLERLEDLRSHLRTVGEHLRPGGLFLVTVFFDRRSEAGAISLPLLCHESEGMPVALPEGTTGEARVRYELVAWRESPPAMLMRRTVLTRGVPGCPKRLVDEYSLRIWRETEVMDLIERTGMYDVLSMEGLPEETGEDPLGEQTLVLRRR